MNGTESNTTPLLQVRDLRTHFTSGPALFGSARSTVKAVDGVSFDLHGGRTLGLVGESGCGKSTLARTILRLIPATGGAVRFAGRDVLTMPPRELRTLRRRMQIVFQDPHSSLNPRLRIETIVGEALSVHGLVASRSERRARVADLLTRVGLTPDDMQSYPHEFSGGQRQRIGIARALALGPDLIICDEPVSALDLSIQAQVLNLLADLQADLGLSYLFVAHDLAVVRHISDDVAVMYLGRIVEQAPAERLFATPRHPYTRALLAADPLADARGSDLGDTAPLADARGSDLGDTAPLAYARGSDRTAADPLAGARGGCAFQPRCGLASSRCCRESPFLLPVDPKEPNHVVACYHA